MSLSEQQLCAINDFINRCTITKVGEKHIAQTPMGFCIGSYKTEQDAKDKIFSMAKARVGVK
jgi:hypothetical protein